jgi:hypothetical protein
VTGVSESSKPHLVLIALDDLGGEADLEAIAVRAWELFPQQFCWRRFPQYPDKDIVRISLSVAKREPDGGLVTDIDLRHARRRTAGRMKRYALTSRGREKVEELRSVRDSTRPPAGRNSLDFRRLVEPVLESDAYHRFVAGVNLSTIGRESFLRAFQLFGDASPYVISGRLARTEAAVTGSATTEERTRLSDFINHGRDAFSI